MEAELRVRDSLPPPSENGALPHGAFKDARASAEENPLFPDHITREKLSGAEKKRLKSEVDSRIRAREQIRKHARLDRPQSQFSKGTRPGSASDVILGLLHSLDGDRVAVFERVKNKPEIRGAKSDQQLKWMIAQVAWRFGFRIR